MPSTRFPGGVSVRNDTVYVEKLALRTAESSLSIDGAVQQYLTTPVVNMQISSDKLSLPEMARLVPAWPAFVCSRRSSSSWMDRSIISTST